jgi:hypothetical protein
VPVDFHAIGAYSFENKHGWGSSNRKGFFEGFVWIGQASVTEIVFPEEHIQFEFGVPDSDTFNPDSLLWEGLLECCRYTVEIISGLLAGHAIEVEECQDNQIGVLTENAVKWASRHIAFRD